MRHFALLAWETEEPNSSKQSYSITNKMAHIISSWHSIRVYEISVQSYVNAIKTESNLSFTVFSFSAFMFEF